MSIELEPEVIKEIENGRKINAIKKLRELRGIGLREAKDLIDLYCSKNNISSPSVQKVNSGNGLVFLIILGVVCYFLYQYFAQSV